MSQLIVLPTEETTAWDVADRESVKTAAEQFNELVKSGLYMAIATKGAETELVNEFQEEAEKVVLTYRQVGG